MLDYLVEEILQRQPERVRDFLLQTSILDMLCGPLCDAVTGQEDGGRMLENLERANLFVVPLDDSAAGIATTISSPTFSECAYWRRSPIRYPSCMGGRASGTSRRVCDPMRSDTPCWPRTLARAADLIELTGPPTDEGSENAAWLRWARALPDELVRARPVLSVWYAYALLGSGQLEAAEARLTDAERWLETTDARGGGRPTRSSSGFCRRP